MSGIVAISVAWTCALASTSAPHHHEDADLLYSTQLAFDGEGNPVITVGLMEGQDSVTVSAAGGLEIQLSGPGRASVRLPGGIPLTASVEDGTPGVTRWRVVLEQLPGGDLEGIARGRQVWGDRGIALEALELGGIVGFPGRVLDNRRSLLVEEGHHATMEEARARAAALTDKWQLPRALTVYADPQTRARGRVVAVASQTGLKLSQDALLSIRAADGGPVLVHKVEYGKGYKHHGFADRAFHGEVILAVDRTAKLAVVNRASAEKLVAGILPSEIFPTAPAAALDAQAITARGEVLAKIGVRHLADPFLTCATQHCQVYSGVAREHQRTNQAAARTKGKMLFDEGGRLVDSVYHAASGGHTEHNEHVWGSSPRKTLRGKPDYLGKPLWPPDRAPTDEELARFLDRPPKGYGAAAMGGKGQRHFRWTREFPARELDRLVNARHEIGRVSAIEVVSRGVSGRAREVRFVGERGEVTVQGELKVRRLLGNLKSAMFLVSRDPASGQWRFVGGGWGHGVGMSQFGAIGRAEAGQRAEQILEHYYGGARVESLY